MAFMVAFHKQIIWFNFNIFNQSAVWSTYDLNEIIDISLYFKGW